MWRNFFDMLRKKYFQTIWKNYNPWKSFYNTNFLELYLSDWKKFVQTNICENFDRKIMATKKYIFVCLKQEKRERKRKRKKKKNGARTATEPMWTGSPELGAVWISLDSPAGVRRPELAGATWRAAVACSLQQPPFPARTKARGAPPLLGRRRHPTLLPCETPVREKKGGKWREREESGRRKEDNGRIFMISLLF